MKNEGNETHRFAVLVGVSSGEFVSVMSIVFKPHSGKRCQPLAAYPKVLSEKMKE